MAQSDISGDDVIVGSTYEDWASGAAYIFHYDGNSWDEEAKFTAQDNARFDRFGYSVSIEGNHVIAGAAASKAKSTRLNASHRYYTGKYRGTMSNNTK